MSNRANAGWDCKNAQPKVVDHYVCMLGTGAAQPTEIEGASVTLNRTGVGIIEIIWPDFPGSYMGMVGHGFSATAQAALKGYSVVAGAFDTTNLKVTINITDSTNTLADLAAAQNLCLHFAFRNAPAAGV